MEQGGHWILKFPSPLYQAIPENEAAMMRLAKLCGINVPEFSLYDLEQISGIPETLLVKGAKFFAIKRFDRSGDNKRIHIEDFCQIYNLYSEDKYGKASYTNLAQTILQIAGENGLIEFIRRLTFSIIIGNGDMHLKNWSIIYKDGRTPSLSPAYDFLSTIPYIPNDRLALSLSKEKDFTKIKIEHFIKLAEKINFPASVIVDVVLQTAVSCWKYRAESMAQYHLPEAMTISIQQHIGNVRF